MVGSKLFLVCYFLVLLDMPEVLPFLDPESLILMKSLPAIEWVALLSIVSLSLNYSPLAYIFNKIK